MLDLLQGTHTTAKPVTVTHEVIKEAILRIQEEAKKPQEMIVPFNYLRYLKPQYRLEPLGRNRFIIHNATA